MSGKQQEKHWALKEGVESMLTLEDGKQRRKCGLTDQFHLRTSCVYVETPISLLAGNSTSKEASMGFGGIPVLASSPAKIDRVDLAKCEFR